jgi:hypothetical protein
VFIEEKGLFVEISKLFSQTLVRKKKVITFALPNRTRYGKLKSKNL